MDAQTIKVNDVEIHFTLNIRLHCLGHIIKRSITIMVGILKNNKNISGDSRDSGAFLPDPPESIESKSITCHPGYICLISSSQLTALNTQYS